MFRISAYTSSDGVARARTEEPDKATLIEL